MKIPKKFLTLFFYIFLLLNINPVDAISRVYMEDLEKSIDLYSNEQYEQSISILDDLIKSGGLDDVTLTRAFFYRGLSNYESENYISAITDITNSLWLDLLSEEEQITALEKRSLARSKIGQDDLAIKDVDTIEKLSKIDKIEEKLDAQNIENIGVEDKINTIKDRFSLNVGNFFGKEDIEFRDSKPSDYVLKDAELYNNILNFKSDDGAELSTMLMENSDEKEVNNLIDIEEKENLKVVQKEEGEIQKNVERIYNEQVNYILISKDLDLSSAKVKINKVVNDNFRALSGIRPEMIENINEGGSKTYNIIIGPFANKSRMDKIADSLTKYNYSFTIESAM